MTSRLCSILVSVSTGCLLVAAVGCSTTPPPLKDSKTSEIHYKLGLAYLSENSPNLQKAYVEFIKAVEANPTNVEAYYALGHIYFQRREYEKAVDAFTKTLAIAPEYTQAHNYLGSTYEALGRDDEAVLAYQKTFQDIQYETPQLPHWNLGMLYLRKQAYDLALLEFQEVQRIEPKNVVVLHKIGETYVAMNDFEKARPFFEEATKIAPQDYRTHDRLAQFYQKAGWSDQAIESLQKAKALSPESHETQQETGALLEIQQ